MPKTNLARQLARRSEGIFAAPFEQGEISQEQEPKSSRNEPV
jgi:hypothetical protein